MTGARATTRWSFGLVAAIQVLCLTFPETQAAQLIVLNHWKNPVDVVISNNDDRSSLSVDAGGSGSVSVGKDLASFDDEAKLELANPSFSADFPKGTQSYAVLVVEDEETVVLYDTNDLQVDLSSAARACMQEDGENLSLDQECLTSHTFGGGMDKTVLMKAFRKLWSTVEYWALCTFTEPAQPLRQFISQAGYQVDVIREKPMVATIRRFISPEICNDLMVNHAGKDDLVMARVGGTGETQTSESRETLTNSVNVNWDVDNNLSRFAMATFDVASELLGEEIPYEGQEPINFLHYRKGYEYKPHTDGRGYKLGDRVATTLVYCEIAQDGGGTAFPAQPSFRYQPENPGDLIFFEYQPTPHMAEHSACPVISGEKSTFTQWHRLGVSPTEPWWNFENWGEFHNPNLNTRWKGPRYGREVEEKETEL